jgi:hypothetical protein
MLRLLLLAGGVFATAGVSFSQLLPASSFFDTRPIVSAVTQSPTTVMSGTTATPIVSIAKAAVTIDYSKPYISTHSGPAVVKKEAFGTVYTTFNIFSNYKTAVAQVPNNSLRWPGGSIC